MLAHWPRVPTEPPTDVTSSALTSDLVLSLSIWIAVSRLLNNSCLSCLMLLRRKIALAQLQLQRTRKSPRKTATLYFVYWSSVIRSPSSSQIQPDKLSEVVSMDHAYSPKVLGVTAAPFTTGLTRCHAIHMYFFAFLYTTFPFYNTESGSQKCWTHAVLLEIQELKPFPLLPRKLPDMWQPPPCITAVFTRNVLDL